MKTYLLGALKALVAGIATSGAALAVILGAPETLVLALWAVLTPLFVYLAPNARRTQ
jgi:hypothetical protein